MPTPKATMNARTQLRHGGETTVRRRSSMPQQQAQITTTEATDNNKSLTSLRHRHSHNGRMTQTQQHQQHQQESQVVGCNCTLCAKLPYRGRSMLPFQSYAGGMMVIQPALHEYFGVAGYDLQDMPLPWEDQQAFERRLHENDRYSEEDGQATPANYTRNAQNSFPGHHDQVPSIDPKTAKAIAEKAARHTNTLQQDLIRAGLLQRADQNFAGSATSARVMAPLERWEVITGPVIGTGGFSTVRAVDDFRLRDTMPSSSSPALHPQQHPLDHTERMAREFLREHAQLCLIELPEDKESDQEYDECDPSDLHSLDGPGVVHDGSESHLSVGASPIGDDSITLDVCTCCTNKTSTVGGSQRSVSCAQCRAQGKRGCKKHSPVPKTKKPLSNAQLAKQHNILLDPHGNLPTVPRYVIKHLRAGLAQEPEKFARAAVDLALEAQLLLAMDHPNIISIRGWSAAGPRAYQSGRHDDFFILLDHLPETLEDRIWTWRQTVKRYRWNGNSFWNKLRQLSSIFRPRHQQQQQKAKPPGKRFLQSQVQLLQCLQDRFQVLCDIASAVAYMHERRIMNRDLKASNVGFDAVTGRVKIFDFGLSRLLPHTYKTSVGTANEGSGSQSSNETAKAGNYKQAKSFEISKDDNSSAGKMTGAGDSLGINLGEKLNERYVMSRVGTKYYMAPEVRNKKPYNLSADIYSFGVVIWEVMALATPSTKARKKVRQDQHGNAEVDARNKFRNPTGQCGDAHSNDNSESFLHRLHEAEQEDCWLPMCPCWPVGLQKLLRSCLADDPDQRPTIAQVQAVLAEHLERTMLQQEAVDSALQALQRRGKKGPASAASRPKVLDEKYHGSLKTLSTDAQGTHIILADESSTLYHGRQRRRSTFRIDLSQMESIDHKNKKHQNKNHASQRSQESDHEVNSVALNLAASLEQQRTQEALDMDTN